MQAQPQTIINYKGFNSYGRNGPQIKTEEDPAVKAAKEEKERNLMLEQ